MKIHYFSQYLSKGIIVTDLLKTNYQAKNSECFSTWRGGEEQASVGIQFSDRIASGRPGFGAAHYRRKRKNPVLLKSLGIDIS